MRAESEGFEGRAGSRARSWLALLGAAVLVVGLAACGEEEVAEEPEPEPEEEPEPEPEPEEETEPEEEPTAEGWVESLAGEFWYEGVHVELTEAELVIDEPYGEPEGTLLVRGEFTNLTDDLYRGLTFPFDEMVLVVDGAQITATGYASDLPDIPEGGQNVGEIVFDVEPDLELAGVELLAGPPAKQHTVLALDGSVEPEGFVPTEVDVAGSVEVDDLTVAIAGGDLWPFTHDRYRQLDDGELSLRLFVDLAFDGTSFSRQMDRDFALELPDGRTVAPEVEPGDTLGTDEAVEGEELTFLVADPPEGPYVLSVTGGDDSTETIEFEL